MTGEVHPVFESALATIRPPRKLAGGAELAVTGELEDVEEQLSVWLARYGMVSTECETEGVFGTMHTEVWSLRQSELVVDVTDAMGLPGPRGVELTVYPSGGPVPQIPITVRLLQPLQLVEAARYVATFELEGGD